MTTALIHTSRSFFVQHVLPAYETFLDVNGDRKAGERRDTIHAAAAAESCLHLVDHVFGDRVSELIVLGYTKTKDFRDALIKRCDAFEVVCDFANAFKHRVIKREGRKLSSLDAVTETCAIVRYQDKSGEYYDVRKVLWVHLHSGKRHPLPDLLHESLGFLTQELVRLGIINSAPMIRAPKPKYVDRSLANLKMHFTGQVGEYFHEQFEKLVYNAKKDSFRSLHLGERFGKVDLECSADIAPSRFNISNSPGQV